MAGLPQKRTILSSETVSLPPEAPILITGATGKVGSILARGLSSRYHLILSDQCQPSETHGLLFVWSDLRDPDSLLVACQGIHTVLHLAATSEPDSPWEDLLHNNLEGTYNLFQSAVEAGCQRVIFASSVMAADAYSPETLVRSQMPPRPSTVYGATKAWGEALGSYYADQKGLSVLCLRLGWVTSSRSRKLIPGHKNLSMVLTEKDLVRLITAALDAPLDLRFGVFHGTSDNHRKRWDISQTRQVLGYAPQDDAYSLARRNYCLVGLFWIKRFLRTAKHRWIRKSL